MWLNKFFVVFLSLIAKLCAAGIILRSAEPKAFMEIDKAAIGVITSCYGNVGNAIGVGGHVSRIMVKTLSFHRIPVVLVHATSTPVQVVSEPRMFRYRLHVYLIAASNSQELRNILIAKRETVYWNHLASLLILYRSPQGCDRAEALLLLAASQYMVHAKLLCFDRRLGVWILGYNPYTVEALEPWRLRAVYRMSKNHFAVFERPYREGKEICKNLEIDNTKNLSGYPVEISSTIYNGAVKNMGKMTQVNNKNRLDKKMGKGTYVRNENILHKSILKTICRAMNATFVITVIGKTVNPRKLPPMRDILLSIMPLENGLKAVLSRPFMETGVVIMTQYSGNKSQFQKIISVIDTYSRIGVCIVLVFTLMFFKFFVGQALMSGILNIVRILCNTGFMNLPRNTPTRVYLSSVLVLAVTIHGIYQGKLASLLTTEVPLPNVNTWQDLIDLGHTIYAYKGFQSLIKDPILKRRLVAIKGRDDCVERVLNDSSAACAHSMAVLMDRAEEFSLHLSELLGTTLQCYIHRPDWPLEKRFDILLERLYEADIITPFYLRMQHKTVHDFKLDEDVKNNEDFRNIALRDLSFAFVILGIGLVCATITFILEIIIHRMSSTIRTRPVHSRTWFR